MIPDGACVLSFLSPLAEEKIATMPKIRLIRGRTRVSTVKARALHIYQNVIARIGLVKLPSGLTLRQQLARPGSASRWWFHRLAARDSESQPHFGWIVQTLVVQDVVAGEGATSLELVGAPPGVAGILRGLCPAVSNGETGDILNWRSVVLGLGSRLVYGCRQIRYRWVIGRRLPRHQSRYDMVFSNFWDWGLKWDKKGCTLADRYFKRLPQLLSSVPGLKFGYFAWFDPYYETDQRGRPLDQVLDPLTGRDDVILLQGYLRYWDIVWVTLNLAPLKACLAARHAMATQKSLTEGGLDWEPIFGPSLVHSCLGAQIPNFELVSIATGIAARRHRPRLTLSFLEHFPHARAHYDGMHSAGIGAVNWAMQHAGMCHEKTFYYLHPKFEFAGETEGCRVPLPDRVFAMGRLGYEIFRECGYREDQVRMIGSARYDHIRFVSAKIEVAPVKSTALNILLACSLDVDTEISLVEAMSLAAQGLSGVSLRLRNHPSNRVDAHPGFAPYREAMEVSSNSLDADLAWAHIVLFTYSTVADEALLLGKAAWQWLPMRFNGSALAEAMPIPTFTSVAQLRAGLESTLAAGGPPVVSASDRSIAAEMLFAPADGGAARRIADQVIDWLDHEDAAAEIDG